MSSTILTFRFALGGVPTDVTSVVLADPTDTFGVQRQDTMGTVVAADTVMTHTGTGVYSYTFTDPAPNLTYTWFAKFVYASLTNFAQFTAQGGGATHYSSQQRLIDRYGLLAVTQASSSTGTIDNSRIDRALTYSDEEINSRYSTRPVFKVPLVTSSGGVPVFIANRADEIAWENLYHARGVNDRPAVGRPDLSNKFSHELDRCYALIAQSLIFPNMIPDAVLNTMTVGQEPNDGVDGLMPRVFYGNSRDNTSAVPT